MYKYNNVTLLKCNSKFSDNIQKVMESRRKMLLDETKYKSDEKKRPGKAKTHSDLFGMEGSFRQLTVD